MFCLHAFCSTSDIQSTTSTFFDNIPVPLVSARGDESHLTLNEQDDDIIGEEVRPTPIDSSMDAKMRALHALLQDHTYVQRPVNKVVLFNRLNLSNDKKIYLMINFQYFLH